MTDPIIFDINPHTAYIGLGGNDAPSHAILVSTYFTNGNEPPCHPSKGSTTSSASAATVAYHPCLPYPFYDPRPSASIFNARGVVEDWDMMERLWSVTDLCGEAVLLTESALNTMAARAKSLELLLEGQGCASVCLSPSPLLALFADGRTDGAVLDVGHQSSFCSAIFEGSVVGATYTSLGGDDVHAAFAGNIWESLQSLAKKEEQDDGGNDGATRRAALHATESIPKFFSTVDSFTRQMRTCFIEGSEGNTAQHFACPDGTELTINISAEAQRKASAVLFETGVLSASWLLSSAPSLLKDSEEQLERFEEYMLGRHTLKNNNSNDNGDVGRKTRVVAPPLSSLLRSLLLQMTNEGTAPRPTVSRAVQLASISSPIFTNDLLLTGGASTLAGLDTVLPRAIKKDWRAYRSSQEGHSKDSAADLSFLDDQFGLDLDESNEPCDGNNAAHKRFSLSVKAERRQLGWIGGSILSTLPAFQHMSSSKSEYDEHGAERIAAMKATNAFQFVDLV